ncbi:MAG: GNAT family N-acetyltransferase [Planctomycetota bacterium]
MSEVSESTIEIVRLEAADWETLRGVRLRALSDTPTAFGSSYETESALSDSDWREKAHKWTDPERCATWIARRDERVVGLVACVFDADQVGRAWLVSMWVDPEVRRAGLGTRLIETARRWAEAGGASDWCLHVTSNNDAAARLYETVGFTATGDSMPHPRFHDLIEHEMRQVLGASR